MRGLPVIISLKEPRSPAAEAYSMLRTNLQFSSPDKPIKSLVVSSASPSEGKTTTAVNLAVTFAQAGNNVLLVDGDMRRPSIHKFFGLPNTAGLSNLIVSGAPAKGAVQTSWVENLFALCSGPIPPNPAKLLSSERAGQLFSGFEQDYDMVIIDSPPVAAASDAVILSAMASGTLLVVDYGAVTKDLAKNVVAQLRNVKANLLGVVLNRVPAKSAGYYYYDIGAKG